MPSSKLFLVTGATGNTGAPTVKLLLAQGHRVRALVHRLDERSAALADLGAEIAVGDFLDFNSMSAAVAGVTAAYFCYPVLPGGLIEATAIFTQAASEAGISAVVNMSQISARRDAESTAAQHHWLSERLLDRAAFTTTHLRPTFFAEWLTWTWQRRESTGALQVPFVIGRHAPISAHDQARVIAAILQNPETHDRQIYPLVGAQELDHPAIAQQISDTLGIPVKYEPIEISAFAKSLAAKGLPEFFIQHISNVAIDYQYGIFSGENNLVEVLTGQKAQTVPHFVDTHRADFSHTGIFAQAS